MKCTENEQALVEKYIDIQDVGTMGAILDSVQVSYHSVIANIFCNHEQKRKFDRAKYLISLNAYELVGN